jgi:hypothetical protein
MKETYWIARWKGTDRYHRETQATGPKLYPSLKMAKARVGKKEADIHFDFIEVSVAALATLERKPIDTDQISNPQRAVVYHEWCMRASG